MFRKEILHRDLDVAIADSDAKSAPLSLLIIDLDHFKDVNDKHGHPFGDEVLNGVGGTISRLAWQRGKCYRYGGEELCVLLLNHTHIEAAIFGERIRAAIESDRISSKQITVTASVGIASFPLHARNKEDLICKADEALYSAKNLGRNLVRISGEELVYQEAVPTEPKRKLPSGRKISESDAMKIRFNHFQGKVAKCPNDDATLRIQEIALFSGSPVGLIIDCPLCGLSDEIMP
jgi:diguanylate cyclase (GGDEF)-like protein